MAEERTADLDLKAKVEEALWYYEPLRQSLSPVSVEVDDGVVVLRGVVPTRIIKFHTLKLARSIPGVREVRDELLTDSDLEVAVGMALARDGRTKDLLGHISANATYGTVVLTGYVESEEDKALVETIARQVPGVRRIVNRLHVEPQLVELSETIPTPA